MKKVVLLSLVLLTMVLSSCGGDTIEKNTEKSTEAMVAENDTPKSNDNLLNKDEKSNADTHLDENTESNDSVKQVENPQEEAEKSVYNLLNALQKLDYNEAEKYTDMETMTAFIEQEGFDNGMGSDAFMNSWFPTLEYSIVSSEIVSENVINVNTKITSRDMSSVFETQFELCRKEIQDNISYLRNLSKNEVSTWVNQKSKQAFRDSIGFKEHRTITTSYSAKVVKENGIWKIEMDSMFINALFGDIIGGLQVLGVTVQTQ